MKQKGFTLIELLAVIAILAIIAIITTPTILNVINDSRKTAAEDKAWGTIDAVKISYAEAQTTGYSEATDSAHGITYDSTNKTLTVDFSNTNIAFGTTPITMSGDRPTSGTVTIDLSTGQVTAKDLVFEKNGDYVCNTNSAGNTMSCEVYTGPSYVYAWNTVPAYYTEGNQSSLSSITPFTTLTEIGQYSGYTFGMKYKIENDKITEAYACGIYNTIEFCIRGFDKNDEHATEYYANNESILRSTFADGECEVYHFMGIGNGLWCTHEIFEAIIIVDGEAAVIVNDKEFCSAQGDEPFELDGTPYSGYCGVF